MNSFVLSESSIHYIAGMLERYSDKYPTKHHQDALAEIRHLSDRLLETLEEPMKVSVIRHRLHP